MRGANAITAELAEFAAALDFASLPPAVPGRVKALLLDLVGITIRARYEADSTEPLLRAVERLGLAAGRCSVIGDARGFAAPAAALINGALAHSLDFDDTHARASLHPSAPIVPAALAAAELGGASGTQVIAAIVAGYEIQIRLSLALVPKDHYDRGFHPTATCGTFGAAAAAGRLLGLTAPQLENAFGLCGSLAAGSMQFLTDGSWNKRFHTGYAAMNGLIAAVSASEGYHGAGAAIEGTAGFLSSYSPNPNFAAATAGLGEVFETLNIGIKPYPSCRYGHAALDALIALRTQHGIDDRDVHSVVIGLPLTGHKIIGEPLTAKQKPRNVVDGQFSMPFVAAVALREGRMAWDDYRRHLDDPLTLALCARIRTAVDTAAEAEFPANMSAIVRIATAHGAFEKLVIVPRGEPENFMTDAELLAKFDTLAAPYLGFDERSALTAALLALDSTNDIAGVCALSRPQPRSAATPRPATRGA
ncbi:MAG TPA: MmgE/PrpD family protein [Gammaproteobacteria bacterium]|nr:MmgE/PrpD family protein [Gammaproteobacteria bacterium]